MSPKSYSSRAGTEQDYRAESIAQAKAALAGRRHVQGKELNSIGGRPEESNLVSTWNFVHNKN